MKNTVAPKFIRMFDNESMAQAFAAKNRGKITIQYRYDSYSNAIIRTYVVKY